MKPSTELLKKYDIPGPRYTSYPTVPYWCDSPSSAQWLESVSQAFRESEKRGIGAALYVHIPFCGSLCTYCGCNTRITRNHKVVFPYIEGVLRELDLYVNSIGRKILLSELHLGGGTPTFLTPRELDHLLGGILSRVTVAKEKEFSIEADPRVTSKEHLETLSRHGFTRLSLGIQDFDPKVQEIVHREQSEAQVRAVTDQARALGFTGINYDLIYGLPFQSRQSIEQTIAAVTRLRPDRIAFYAYAHVPWIKPGQRRFTEEDLPAGDAKRELYELGRNLLQEVGYREIGMDHFSLESDPLWKASLEGTLHRNFMGYTARYVAPQIGLGVSSIGDSWNIFAQNEKVYEGYMAKIEKGELPLLRGHILTEEDRILRRHVLNLMTRFETDWASSELQTPYLDTVHSRLSEFAADGLVVLAPHMARVTAAGRPFLRNICMAFDARLSRQAPSTTLFSKTI